MPFIIDCPHTHVQIKRLGIENSCYSVIVGCMGTICDMTDMSNVEIVGSMSIIFKSQRQNLTNVNVDL